MKEKLSHARQEDESQQAALKEERELLLQKVKSLQESLDSVLSSKQKEMKEYEEQAEVFEETEKQSQRKFEEWKLQQEQAVSQQMVSEDVRLLRVVFSCAHEANRG